MLLTVMLIVLVNSAVYGFDADNTSMHMRYILYIMMYVYIFSLYCICRYPSIPQFGRVYIGVMLFQAASVYAAAWSTKLRVFLYNTTIADQYEEDMLLAVQNGSRLCGIQLMASAGSLMLCTGCILLVYLALNRYIGIRRFLVSYFFLGIATMLIGRTGFYIELLLLVYYFTESKGFRPLAGAAAGAAVCAVGLSFLTGRLDAWIVSYYKRWIGEIFYSDRFRQTLEWIGLSKVPPFSGEMIFGTNVMKGMLPTGFQMTADSGYARMYCAVGIVGCFFYYGSFIVMYACMACKMRSRKDRRFYGLCILLSLIIEYKEPFFLKYFFPFVVLVLGMFICSRSACPSYKKTRKTTEYSQ